MMPQNPRQGTMWPGPPRMRPGFGGRAPMMGMNQRPMSPMMGRNRMPRPTMMGGSQQMNRGGGLFSRLLGMGNQSGRMGGGLMGMQQAGRAAGAGGSMFGNPGGIMGFLNNTQQVLKTAQSIGPMVQQFQQYGSLVKNIPAMWKLYRGLKSAPVETETNSKSSSKTSKNKTSSKHENNSAKTTSSTQRNSQQKVESTSEIKQKSGSRPKTPNKKNKGSSIPKMYI